VWVSSLGTAFELLASMETTKYSLKNLSSLLVFCSLMMFNQACQFASAHKHEITVQDEVRKFHAEELLSSQSVGSVKAFDGDIKFTEYINRYIKSKNKKINADKFTRTLLQVSQKYSYDPIFLLAVITTESNFNFNAIGTSGEIGLMQLKPDTAEWICKKNNIVWLGPKALKNPEYNIILGSYYFQYLKKTLNSKSRKYVNAYNVGLTSLHRMADEDLKSHPYYGKVIKNYLHIYSDLKNIRDKKAKV
jgi:soluble lytic murein transglycosylase